MLRRCYGKPSPAWPLVFLVASHCSYFQHPTIPNSTAGRPASHLRQTSLRRGRVLPATRFSSTPAPAAALRHRLSYSWLSQVSFLADAAVSCRMTALYGASLSDVPPPLNDEICIDGDVAIVGIFPLEVVDRCIIAGMKMPISTHCQCRRAETTRPGRYSRTINKNY